MYSLNQKQFAIEMVLKCISIRVAHRMLNYPGSRNTLNQWMREYQSGTLEQSVNKKRNAIYSDEQINYAIDYYLNNNRNISKTVANIGYPCRSLLFKWIQEKVHDKPKHVLKGSTLLNRSYQTQVLAEHLIISGNNSFYLRKMIIK